MVISYFRHVILLAGLLAFAPTHAMADIECKRKTNSWQGFVDAKAHDSWYPKIIYFEIKNAKTAERNRLRFSEGYAMDDLGSFRLSPDMIWEMLPNGQIFGKFAKNQRSGYKQITPRKYVCSMDVSEILAQQQDNAPAETPQKTSSAAPAPSPQPNKLDKAKSECSDLGFKAGTQNHGECVLKILETL